MPLRVLLSARRPLSYSTEQAILLPFVEGEGDNPTPSAGFEDPGRIWDDMFASPSLLTWPPPVR